MLMDMMKTLEERECTSGRGTRINSVAKEFLLWAICLLWDWKGAAAAQPRFISLFQCTQPDTQAWRIKGSTVCIL